MYCSLSETKVSLSYVGGFCLRYSGRKTIIFYQLHATSHIHAANLLHKFFLCVSFELYFGFNSSMRTIVWVETSGKTETMKVLQGLSLVKRPSPLEREEGKQKKVLHHRFIRCKYQILVGPSRQQKFKCMEINLDSLTQTNTQKQQSNSKTKRPALKQHC